MIALRPNCETYYVIPAYYGGPWDGGFGAIEPTSGVMGTIRLSGGRYSLQGFSPPATFVADTLTQITPDYSVYQWEVGPC
jgi:hypothetical protein